MALDKKWKINREQRVDRTEALFQNGKGTASTSLTAR